MEASIIWLPSLIVEPAEDRRVDAGVDGDVAAGAGPELGLQGVDLIVIQRMGGDHLGRGLATMIGGQAAEGADDRPELALAAVRARTPRKLVVIGSSPTLPAIAANALPASFRGDQRALHQQGQVAAIRPGPGRASRGFC